MKRRIEYQPGQKLVAGDVEEDNVVMIFDKNRRGEQITVIGSQSGLENFDVDYCTSCQAGLKSSLLEPMTRRVPDLYATHCEVELGSEGGKLCDQVEDDEHFEVPDNNWYEVDPRVLDGLMNTVKPTVENRMVLNKKSGVVVATGRRQILVTGGGSDLGKFLIEKCGTCKANPMRSKLVPDETNTRDDVTVVCRPISVFRKCN